ncbi:hypothetical protein [Donghicola tyrosinivorans]|uniref:Uncharacterized protein n=1 Tax=Donghicola tyrosinivorans TaxID=1652492 RepID=A0A2T0WEE3_9RHOB|nr:hypothetical protein [Donghicola tyrosinivorans]PRY85080.1 hypothetical protein CLV74_11851 [Donghicola tyrosinivorans]
MTSKGNLNINLNGGHFASGNIVQGNNNTATATVASDHKNEGTLWLQTLKDLKAAQLANGKSINDLQNAIAELEPIKDALEKNDLSQKDALNIAKKVGEIGKAFAWAAAPLEGLLNRLLG